MRVKWIDHKAQSKPATADCLVSRRARYKRLKKGKYKMKTTGVRMAVQKIEINIFYYNCGFLGCQLALAERDPAHMVRARRVPRVTRTGRRVHMQRC